MTKDLTQLTITEAAKGLRAGDFSALDLTEACLEKNSKEDGNIKAFLEIFREEALEQARSVDRILNSHKEIPILAGIPLAIKDNILVKGKRCSAASRILEDYTASYSATVIEKLQNQQAIILGKTNLDEFAMGSSTENSAFQVTHNPCDLDKVPGGSSGGSAAAIASNQVLGALGSETGGSVRQPAAFCGLVGLKPTYGAVSRYGLIAFASSLDQIGSLAKTSQDCYAIFQAIKGRDVKDATSRDGNFDKEEDLSHLKIGVPKQCLEEGISKEMIAWSRATINYLEKKGAEIISVDLPSLNYALAVYYVIAPAEASANLARYDGLRYGKGEVTGSLRETYAKTRSAGFGTEVKRRILLGTYTLSSGHYDAYYQKAQKARQLIQLDFEKILKQVDLILTPTTPTLPFSIGAKIDDPVEMYLSDLLTVSANLTGLPAISIPVGKEGKYPVGMQLIGSAFSERFLTEAGNCLEWLK